jgi:hypothetical protein
MHNSVGCVDVAGHAQMTLLMIEFELGSIEIAQCRGPVPPGPQLHIRQSAVHLLQWKFCRKVHVIE